MTSRGRFGQYRKLTSDKRLSKYLLETELLSEKSLFTFTEKYKTAVIKPVFGPGQIYVSSEDNQYKIISKSNLITLIDKQHIYEHLVNNELTQKYYIIQPGNVHSRFFRKTFQHFVTVHRSSLSSKWNCLSNTAKLHSLLGKLLYRFFLRKIENLSILAAKKLSESFPECNSIVIEIAFNLKGEIWIQDTVLHLSRSKWDQHQVLNSNHFLSSYVPETDLITESSFKEFLNKYKEVIIKPCIGQEGVGVIKITANNNRNYEIDTGTLKYVKFSCKEAYRFIEENYLTNKYYIIQKRLPLAMINDSPFDIRVLTQKHGPSWIVTGKLIKVANQGVFNTNPPEKYMLFEDGIQDANIQQKIKATLKRDIERICLVAAKKLKEKYPNLHIIGFDIAVTNQGDIWIIEGNYAPDLYMFYEMEDKDIYLYIMKTKEK